MLTLHKPALQALGFRQGMLADPETMRYNHAWGGTIAFPPAAWPAWYDRWVAHPEDGRFYRYLMTEDGRFVGEAAYHRDAEGLWQADVIVYAPFRGQGYGTEGLRLLCAAARENGLTELYDTIAADNPAIGMFLRAGFVEVRQDGQVVLLRKAL